MGYCIVPMREVVKEKIIMRTLFWKRESEGKPEEATPSSVPWLKIDGTRLFFFTFNASTFQLNLCSTIDN